MLEPMNLVALRELAAKNGSVNVHEATAWDLRWHDPFWNAAWQRWQTAKNIWRLTWVQIPLDHLYGSDRSSIYVPDPSLIDEPAKSLAQEYIDARDAYKAACDLYQNKME